MVYVCVERQGNNLNFNFYGLSDCYEKLKKKKKGHIKDIKTIH